MRDEIKIAYAAGLIDGEGCLRIKKSKPVEGRKVTFSYQLRVQVRMVEEAPIAFLRDLFGGTYYKEKQKHENRRPMYCYHVSDQIAMNLVLLIIDHLLVKRQQAELLIKLGLLKKQAKHYKTKVIGYKNFPNLYVPRQVPVKCLSDEYISACEKLFQESKYLNRVGRKAMEN